MPRVFNFSAGPAMLPEPVLERAREEMLDWQGTGMSVLEMSHRGAAFTSIAADAEARLRALMAIPDDYRVLFLQGGASSQFSMVPLNLLGAAERSADYVDTGSWSKKAIAEAQRLGRVRIAASGKDSGFTAIPRPQDWQLDPHAAYLHYTPNETIGGVEFHFLPDSPGIPLIADFSSSILSRPVPVDRFGLIYPGAQKNIGPAGLCVVIVREDLIGEPRSGTPAMFSYRRHAEAGSMYNTPPTYAWYLAGLVFEWIEAQGGLEEMGRRSQRKADKVYAAIDGSEFYDSPIQTDSRSRMNIPFTLADPMLDRPFLEQAAAAGLHELKGHRSVGGMRASMYNAMPEAGTDALVAFMSEFERRYG